MLRVAFLQTPVSSEFSMNNNSFSIRIIPYKNGGGEVLCAVILQNVTETKVIENKLKDSMKDAEEANKAKDIFVARMSHEIRTPLNAVIGFAEQLKGTRLTKKQSDYVDIVNNSSRHLLSIIDDILVLSKIESGTIELDESPFSVNNVFAEIDRLLEMRYRKKGLNFYRKTDFLKGCRLLGDAEKLKQILINLVNNAIKYTKKGDKEFTLLMLNTFVKNTGKMIKKLRACMKRNDYAMIGEVAHKLSPSVEQMGFKKSSGLLKQIDNRYLKNKDIKKDPGLIRDTIDQLQDEVALIKQKISEMS